MAFSGTRPGLGVKKEAKVKSNGLFNKQAARNPLVVAMSSNLPVAETRTENGMVTNKSSLNAATDFFFMAAALRKGGRIADVTKMFGKVFNEDKQLAIRLLFWLRDIRGGAGEKLAFSLILRELFKSYHGIFAEIVKYVPEYGSFKDLIVEGQHGKRTDYVYSSPEVRDLFASELKAGNGLAAKWLPRPSGKHVDEASVMSKHMGLSLKEYRHLLAELTNAVEQQMSARRWEDITYEHVPSQAMHVYRTAFFRHDEARFQQTLQKAVKGEVVMKAGAIFPGDLVLKIGSNTGYGIRISTDKNTRDAVDAQWMGLPDWMNETPISMIVAADVSGSMRENSAHSVGLALYVAQHVQGPFRNSFMTFSGDSKFYTINEGARLSEALSVIKEDNMNTNLRSVFTRLLAVAQANSIQPEDMPQAVVVASDMEFDGVGGMSALEMVAKEYKKAGYAMPQLIFWNIASRHENVPARANQTGVKLISGYSPAIMKSVIASKPQATPTELMLETINGPRYEQIIVQ